MTNRQWRPTALFTYTRGQWETISWHDTSLIAAFDHGPGWYFNRLVSPCIAGPFDDFAQCKRACDALVEG